jgi:lysozyme
MIERDEGCVLHAYPDPATGGDPWTIGYGHTGPDVHPGLVITQTDAQALLEKDLDKFADGVSDLLIDGARTNDNQYSACVSLAFNVGLGNFEKSSVLRFHNAGQYQQAADAFLLWDKAAGRVMPGLVRRRHQEREMYLGLAIDP